MKVEGCANNLKISSATKIRKNFAFRYSMLTIWVHITIENKHTLQKSLFKSLQEHAKNINDFEKKKMFPLTKEELKSYQVPKV